MDPSPVRPRPEVLTQGGWFRQRNYSYSHSLIRVAVWSVSLHQCPVPDPWSRDRSSRQDVVVPSSSPPEGPRSPPTGRGSGISRGSLRDRGSPRGTGLWRNGLRDSSSVTERVWNPGFKELPSLSEDTDGRTFSSLFSPWRPN